METADFQPSKSIALLERFANRADTRHGLGFSFRESTVAIGIKRLAQVCPKCLVLNIREIERNFCCIKVVIPNVRPSQEPTTTQKQNDNYNFDDKDGAKLGYTIPQQPLFRLFLYFAVHFTGTIARHEIVYSVVIAISLWRISMPVLVDLVSRHYFSPVVLDSPRIRALVSKSYLTDGSPTVVTIICAIKYFRLAKRALHRVLPLSTRISMDCHISNPLALSSFDTRYHIIGRACVHILAL